MEIEDRSSGPAVRMDGARGLPMYRSDLLDRLARFSVHVRPFSTQAFLIALTALLAATALRFAAGWSQSSLLLSVFLPAVLATGLFAGVFAASAVTLASGVVVWFVFVPRYFELAPLTRDELSGFLIFLFAAAGTIAFTEFFRLILRQLHEKSRFNELLLRELQHRSRNTFAVIEVVVQKTLAHDRENAHKLTGRIRSIVYANDLLTGVSQKMVTLQELLWQAFVPFGTDRFVPCGPEVNVAPSAARHLILIFHELATNALKYGALSSGTGLVFVDWDYDGDGIVLRWREDGGPRAVRPVKIGFGTKLIQFCAKALAGSIDDAFAEEGFRCQIQIGATALRARWQPPRTVKAALGLMAQTCKTPQRRC